MITEGTLVMDDNITALVANQNMQWVIIATAFILFMQAGFCFLEVGSVRSKNSINVAVKNISDFCVANVVFLTFGFAIMFSNSALIINTDYLFLSGVDTPQLMTFFMFQAVFCGTATTILSGAIAERATFFGYLIIAIFISSLIYPVFGRMAWNGALEGEAVGWLNQQGFIDFAGSSVVHSVGGWVALAAVIVIGPRIGRFKEGMPPIQGHNIPMATIGTIMLWFGWIGFNAGSTLAMNDAVPKILINTNTSAAFGGLTTLALTWLIMKKPNVPHVLNGVLAGLVSITANCHAVEVYQAALIGMIGGSIYLCSHFLLEKLKIDDVVSAIPVHGFCGMWGTLAVAFFGNSNILATGLNFQQQLLIQITGVVICFILSFGGTFLFLMSIKSLLPLRVSREHEIDGLNITEHDASTEVLDLLYVMEKQKILGDFSQQVKVEPHTEIGQIATEYNRVLDKINIEMGVSLAAKQVIENAHNKIKDSINYASLIQYSIVPKDSELKNAYADYFTIWTPRDVIGGDIYLFSELRNGNECLLMVIDCTGHGVPGAFVTMLVKAIERQILGKIEHDATISISPGWILAYFNRKIKTLLHQESTHSKCNAGFDGGVILYNKQKNLIKYAGAQLPLFMIQDNAIKIIKGDRHSVGYKKCAMQQVYQDHQITINKNTYFYLSTDGYIDQNGGKKNFPFGKTRLQNILLKIHKSPFSEQKQIIIEENQIYMQSEEITDDVTMIGFKVEPNALEKTNKN